MATKPESKIDVAAEKAYAEASAKKIETAVVDAPKVEAAPVEAEAKPAKKPAAQKAAKAAE